MILIENCIKTKDELRQKINDGEFHIEKEDLEKITKNINPNTALLIISKIISAEKSFPRQLSNYLKLLYNSEEKIKNNTKLNYFDKWVKKEIKTLLEEKNIPYSSIERTSKEDQVELLYLIYFRRSATENEIQEVSKRIGNGYTELLSDLEVWAKESHVKEKRVFRFSDETSFLFDNFKCLNI